MQSFVDERSVHAETRVIETSTKLGGDDIEIEFVSDWKGALIWRVQRLVRTTAHVVRVRKVESIRFCPLKSPW